MEQSLRDELYKLHAGRGGKFKVVNRQYTNVILEVQEVMHHIGGNTMLVICENTSGGRFAVSYEEFLGTTTTGVITLPNYTLIDERGVK